MHYVSSSLYLALGDGTNCNPTVSQLAHTFLFYVRALKMLRKYSETSGGSNWIEPGNICTSQHTLVMSYWSPHRRGRRR